MEERRRHGYRRTGVSRGLVFRRANCPFINLPEKHKGRRGDGLTADDMKRYVGVRSELVAQSNLWNGPNPIPCGMRRLQDYD